MSSYVVRWTGRTTQHDTGSYLNHQKRRGRMLVRVSLEKALRFDTRSDATRWVKKFVRFTEQCVIESVE